MVAAPGVLANDTGPKGSTGLTASLVASPADGTLSFNSDGSFTYTPNSGYFGTDSFTYKAVDPYGNSTPTIVSITVAPATMCWAGCQTGNWTDQQWSGTCLPCPDCTTNAVVDTPSAVQVTSSQAAYALAVQSGGEVAVGPDAALSVTTATSVTGGSTLSVAPGGAFFSGGTVTVVTGTLCGGPVIAAAYQLNDGTVSADLYGAGGVTVGTATATGGTVTLSGANFYAGPTVVKAGTLIVASAGGLPSGSSLVVGSSASILFARARRRRLLRPWNLPRLPRRVPPYRQLSRRWLRPAWRQVHQSPHAMHRPGSASASVASDAPSTAMPAAVSTATIDAVFKSDRSALAPTAASANIPQSVRWAWLAEIESSWNSSYQNKTTDSTVKVRDEVLARFGL